MAWSSIMVLGKRVIDVHNIVLPSMSSPSRTADLNCAKVQLPMPAVFDMVMFGPYWPAAVSAWQLAQAMSLLAQTRAPLAGSPAVGAEPPDDVPPVEAPLPPAPGEPAPPLGVVSVLLQPARTAATAVPNTQTNAKLCKVLKTKSFSEGWKQRD